MDIADHANELRAIEAALGSHFGPTITGTMLFELIRHAAPGLDIRAIVGIPKGPGALTEFIRRHLSDVVERIGNKGADILYHINGREVTEQAPSVSPQVWRTFISPNSPQYIVLSCSSQRLLSRDTSASAAEGELDVPKASLDEHDKIRADFVASLPEPKAAVLRKHVATNADFELWIAALREHLPEMIRPWGNYRRRRLSELFTARITELDLDQPLKQAVFQQAKFAEISAYDMRNGAKAVLAKLEGRQGGAPDNATIDETSRARRLAHGAIDLLAYDELRALRIPLGVLLDAIRAEA